MDFICKDYNSALQSLSQTIGVSEERIISVLKHDWDKQYEKDERVFIQSNAPEDSFLDDWV